MKIINLTQNSKLYTSNAYLVLGTWNGIDDVNTLIDAGSDPMIIDEIEKINTGLGKNKIDQVILTHSHSDHSGNLQRIIDAYHPRVCALNSHLKGIDQHLTDGDMLHIADQQFEVYHFTTHSYDSICLYGAADGTLFSGDTSFPIQLENEQLRLDNQKAVNRLQHKLIETLYPGHGDPLLYTDKNKLQILINTK